MTSLVLCTGIKLLALEFRASDVFRCSMEDCGNVWGMNKLGKYCWYGCVYLLWRICIQDHNYLIKNNYKTYTVRLYCIILWIGLITKTKEKWSTFTLIDMQTVYFDGSCNEKQIVQVNIPVSLAGYFCQASDQHQKLALFSTNPSN